MTVVVNLVVTLGMLVVLPLGLRLVRAPGLEEVLRVWPVPAVLGAVSLWLPRGSVATVLAVVYAGGTLALVVVALARLRERRRVDAGEVAVLTALVTPSVAGVALVAERSGHELFGFDLPILALTVPHFHYAGFAAALVAGLVSRQVGAQGGLARVAALSVPAGTGIVLAGYFVDDWLELVGAVVLTVGMWSVGWLTWAAVRPEVRDRATRTLLGVSSVVLVATMVLALSWAVGEATGLPHPSLTWMVATHGAANALGFALCGVLAWRRLPARALV